MVSQKTDISERRFSYQCIQDKQFDKDVQKLKELIRKCEELEVNNRNYTNSIHFENQINSSRGITSNENTNSKRV